MIECPNCRDPMAPQWVEGHGVLEPIEINACEPCSLFWFDKLESVRLTPKSVIGLFQFIGKAGSARRTIAANFNCPRCALPLAVTHDLQRTTRFTYWRCNNDGGQLITFHQFLRQKNFIRTPTPVELAKLRSTVRQITCSQCGASIDLATDSACTHCGSPIALIDPDGGYEGAAGALCRICCPFIRLAGCDAHGAERCTDRRYLPAATDARARWRFRSRGDRRRGDWRLGGGRGSVDLVAKVTPDHDDTHRLSRSAIRNSRT